MAKADPKKTVVLAKRPTGYSDAAGFKTAYANSVSIQITPWDFTFLFGRILEATETRLTVERQVEVVMSPQHVKSVLTVLARQMDLYEQKHGAVPNIIIANEDGNEEEPTTDQE